MSAPAAATQPEKSTTALGGWALASMAVVLALYAWPRGQAGNDLWCGGAVLAFLVAFKMTFAGWRAFDTNAAYRRVRKKAVEDQDHHGDAEWATWKDCKAEGLDKPGGLFLGTLDGKDVTFNGEGSMVVFGGPGQGKSTASVMQNILRLDKHSSAVVLDLKLENYAVCAADLHRRGFQVKVANAWWATFNRDFRGSLKTYDDGLDPCLLLQDSESVVDDARLIASLLSGSSAETQSSSESFWKTFQEDIHVAFILLLLHRHGSVTLPDLRRALMVPEAKLEAAIEEMEQSDAFNGVLAEYGARLAGPYTRNPKEFSGGMSGAQSALNWLDASSPLAESMSGSATTDPRTLKDRPTVIFIGIPAEKVITHERYLGLALTSTLEMIARDRRKKRVVALIDEAQQLPPSVGTILLKSISLYRSVGLQTVLYYQFAAAAARQLKDSWRELLGVDVVALFGHTNDMETLRLFSELMGERTVQSVSASGRPETVHDGDLGVSFNVGTHARRLQAASELRQMANGKALYFVRNMKPLLLDKQSYLDNPKLRKRAAPNPYYRK